MSEPFIGEIKIFSYNFAPRGWAFCCGQLLPISQNTALFSILGTTYGGDGRTTFGLPNLKDRAPMHPGNGPGLTSRRLGQLGGVDNVTLSLAQMPSHTHTLTGSNALADTPDAIANTLARATNHYQSNITGSLVPLATESMPPLGGGQSHNNRQPSLALGFCIALVGVYPSRS